MKSLQKLGGVAALIMAGAFVVGFVFLVTLLANYGSLDVDPVQNVDFLMENQALVYLWHLIIYVVFGVFLVILTLALYERLKAGSPAMAQTATAFGIIWAGLMFASGMVANIGAGIVVDIYAYGRDPAQAGSLWLALQFVVEGLGGGNEIVGGLWVLLASWAALRAGGLPRVLNYLGLVVSVSGLLTVVPALGELGGAVFGLGSIVWFVWLGIVMLRRGPSVAE